MIFTLSHQVTLGTPEAFVLRGSPAIAVANPSMIVNAPGPGEFRILSLRVRNTEHIDGELDASVFSPTAAQTKLDLRITPADVVTVQCDYNGHVPAGMTYGQPFNFMIGFAFKPNMSELAAIQTGENDLETAALQSAEIEENCLDIRRPDVVGPHLDGV